MMKTGTKSGFTLVELMIVVAIIAIIASIAIPSMINAMRASNERNASTSLKSFLMAQTDFRSNDRDANGIQDFWTRDVSGLYALCAVGSSHPLRLIDIGVCAADADPQGTAPAPVDGDEVSNLYFTIQAPKSGYWFLAMENDQYGNPFAQLTGGNAPFNDKRWFNRDKFSFMAFPESYRVGQNIYILNESYGIFRRQLIGDVRPPGGAYPPGRALLASGAIGAAPLLSWPTDAQFKVTYIKLD